MEQLRRIPMRTVLLLGMIAVGLYVLSGFYNYATPVVTRGSTAGPILISLVTILPLAAFYFWFFLRVTVPKLLQIGALVGGIGAVLLFLLRVYYLFTLKSLVYDGFGSGATLSSIAMVQSILSWALAAGALVMGVAFLKHPNPLYARLGLITIVGSGCSILLSMISTYLPMFFGGNPLFLLALLHLVFWAPFFLLLLNLYRAQPPAPPKTGTQWKSPYDPPSY